MVASIIIGFLLGGLPQTSLPSQPLPEQVAVQLRSSTILNTAVETAAAKTKPTCTGFKTLAGSQVGAGIHLYRRDWKSPRPIAIDARSQVKPTVSIASKPSAIRSVPPAALPSEFEVIIESSCNEAPTGFGIPGFQPGISKSDVLKMLGVPSVSSSGYWPNTRAVSYELVPEQISLGFLFDKKSERIRQTEASFTANVDARAILLTLNGMLGCKLNESIEQGFEKVRQGQLSQYSFNLGQLKGVIERNKRDRIYIGIWERDLH